MNYVAYLRKDRKGAFSISFPDFPACIAAVEALTTVQQAATEALTRYIAGMSEDGETIPEPSTLEALANDPARAGAIVFVVHVELPKAPQM
jgi:predicted RNase H-like HicB family nuclease